MKAIGRKVIILTNKKEEVTKSGLIVKENQQTVLSGKVLSIGDKVSLVEKDQEVYYSPYDFEELDKDHHIIDEDEIWAIKSQ